MTNKTDEFDQEAFDPMDISDQEMPSYRPKQNLVQEWLNKPIVKLLLIMAVISLALAAALGVFSEDRRDDLSRVASAPGLKEAPGGAASQFFIEQNEQANIQRAGEALQTGGSALPTPVGHDISTLVDKRPDPMLEFRAETERLRKELQAERQATDRRLQQMQQSQAQPRQEDDSLARAMQRQMEQLMESWAPRSGQFVMGVPTPDLDEAKAAYLSGVPSPEGSYTLASGQVLSDILVPAGTVNYIQLLTEANSDVPGPVLAQILSGPMAGGRAIGSFQVMNDYLVIRFTMVSLKGKTYRVDALALDPDTTLGGMATEVNQRYLVRILLPAAGAFVQAFGDTLSETETSTTVSDGTVVADQAKKGYKEAIYAGVGSIGETMSQFFKQQANQTKALVRVAVGTPMGMFFLTPVMKEGAQQAAEGNQNPNQNQSQLLQGYQTMGGIQGQAPQPQTYRQQPAYGQQYDGYNSAAGMPAGGSLNPSQMNLIRSLTAE